MPWIGPKVGKADGSVYTYCTRTGPRAHRPSSASACIGRFLTEDRFRITIVLTKLLMLTIRSQQMEVLETAQAERFEREIAAHIRERFPRAAFVGDDQRLRSFVAESIRLARTFGLHHRFDLRRFIEFRAEYGENFHQLEWASKILNDKYLSGCGKMEQIDSYSLYVLR